MVINEQNIMKSRFGLYSRKMENKQNTYVSYTTCQNMLKTVEENEIR